MIQFLYREWEAATRQVAALRHGERAHSDTAGGAYDTTGEGATTRPNTHHDTALCAQPEQSGRAAWVRVCTWCTQPSFDSVHCSESLFRTLFMSTVHDVFKKNKNKKIK